MRVLLATSERGLRGGELQAAALARGLAGRGHDVAVALPGGSGLERELGEAVAMVRLPFEPLPVFTPAALARFMRGWRPDVVHAQSSRAHTHARLAQNLCARAAQLVVSRRVSFPVSRGPWGLFKYRRGVAHFIPISRAAARSLLEAGVSAEMMTVVPSGIDSARFAAAEKDRGLLGEWGIGPGDFVVGTVAAFEREKGHGILIEAARTVCAFCPNCRFVFVGSGRLEKRLRRRASDLADRIVFARQTAPLERILPLFHLYVLPSLDEGLSSALVAAMASGLPVVASRTGGIPEVVDGGAGVLVPPGDAAALAEAIRMLVENDEERIRLGREAARVARRFDIEKTISGTLAVYMRVLEASQKKR